MIDAGVISIKIAKTVFEEMYKNGKDAETVVQEQGLVQAFEYTYELAWNVVRDYLREQGNQDIHGSRDAIREAFSLELIKDGEGWMEMLKDRNLTAHTYNEETARAIAEHVSTRYFDLFAALQQTMQGIADARSQADG